MTINFPDPAPLDIQIERQVDQAILGGHSLPRWGWALPASYNAHTGSERVFGWQKMMVAERLGLMARRGTCTVCRSRTADHRHTENYLRPMVSPAICRACHFQVHRRFRDPAGWQMFMDQAARTADWISHLRTFELDREQAEAVAREPDIFAALRAL